MPPSRFPRRRRSRAGAALALVLAVAACGHGEAPRSPEFELQGEALAEDPLFSIPVPGSQGSTLLEGVTGSPQPLNRVTAIWVLDDTSQEAFAEVLSSARATGVVVDRVSCRPTALSAKGAKEIRGRAAGVFMAMDLRAPFGLQIEMSVDDTGSPLWPPPSFAVDIPSVGCPDFVMEAAGLPPITPTTTSLR